MLLKNIIFVFLLICFDKVECEEIFNFTFPDGDIQGQRHQTLGDNLTYCSFRGLPYAKPPVNNLRFADPIENEPWNVLRDATYDRSQCCQFATDDLLGDEMLGSEDCLYLNVYIPTEAPDPNASLPVLVWIHGGSFMYGNSSYAMFAPDHFLDQKLVFVSFNYRLGIFGFLSTEDEACPGNWGIKDQILALKWVQKNIAYFGGNPANVTIYGESAGAVSVSILMQTELTKGLFHKAIMSSGTSLNLWGLNTRGCETSKILGTKFGIITDNSTCLVEQLRSIEAEQLQKDGWTVALTNFEDSIQENGFVGRVAPIPINSRRSSSVPFLADSSEKIPNDSSSYSQMVPELRSEPSFPVTSPLFLTNALRGLPWAPTMEPANIKKAVLVKASASALSQGSFHRVSVLIGMNSNEAAVFSDIPFLIRLYLLYYDIVVSYLTPYSMTTDDGARLLAGNDIKQRFFGLIPIAASGDKLTDFVSADQFFRPIIQCGAFMSLYTNVYFYIFGYKRAIAGVSESESNNIGVGHAEDLQYVFPSNNNHTETDDEVSKMLVKLLCNFAKYGDPTPYEDQSLNNTKWLPVTGPGSNFTYMWLNQSMTPALNPKPEILDYYSNLWNIYGDGSKITTY